MCVHSSRAQLLLKVANSVSSDNDFPDIRIARTLSRGVRQRAVHAAPALKLVMVGGIGAGGQECPPIYQAGTGVFFGCLVLAFRSCLVQRVERSCSWEVGEKNAHDVTAT